MSLAFPVSEYQKRVQQVQAEMTERGLNAVVITRPQNYYYLTGFRSLGQAFGTFCAIVPAEGEPRMLIRSLERKLLDEYTWTSDNEFVDDDEKAVDYLVEMLSDVGAAVGTVGMELGSQLMSPAQFAEIEAALLDAEIKDVTWMVDHVRQVKSERELEYMRKAADIAEQGIRAAAETIEPGVTNGEAVVAAIQTMFAAGQDDVSRYPCLVWGGPTGGLMHDTHLDTEFEEGDFATLEVVGSYELYCANVMSPVYVGDDPPDDLYEKYQATRDLHDAGVDALQPGNRAEDVHAAVDQVYREAGGGEYYRRVGGTIGISFIPSSFFEGASLVKGEKRTLEPNMTLLVQPGPIEPEMMVVGSTSVIAEDGHEQITTPLEDFVY